MLILFTTDRKAAKRKQWRKHELQQQKKNNFPLKSPAAVIPYWTHLKNYYRRLITVCQRKSKIIVQETRKN